VASMAYLFTFPLVMNYRDMYRQVVDRSSAFSGGFGSWRHERKSRISAGRLEDVVQSSVWLDLRAEPYFCEIGEVPPDVVFTARLVDLWGFVIEDWGALHRAKTPLLVSAPLRLHHVPSRIEVVARGGSGFVELQTETRWRDASRFAGSEPVQPDIVLKPMSSHLGGPAAPSAPTVKWRRWHDGVAISDEYWACANFVLSLTTPNPVDRPIHDRIAEIGVAPGDGWDASALCDDVLEAIGMGMDEALSDLLEASGELGTGVPAGPLKRADLDRHYFAHALDTLPSHDRLEIMSATK
jgi:hypothetical protein